MITPYVEKYLAAEPALSVAQIFLPELRDPRIQAWMALEHELLATLFMIHEPSVAQTKLQWWAQELAQASQGQVRHPIVETLRDLGADNAQFAQAAGAAVSALRLLEAESIADFDELVKLLGYVILPIASLRAAQVVDESLAHNIGSISLLSRRNFWSHDFLHRPEWMPGVLLARHGIPRSALVEGFSIPETLLVDLQQALRLQLQNFDQSSLPIVERTRLFSARNCSNGRPGPLLAWRLWHWTRTLGR